jgi:hypothetical protein
MSSKPPSIDSLPTGWGHTPNSLTVAASMAGGGKNAKLSDGGDKLSSRGTRWQADYLCHSLM